MTCVFVKCVMLTGVDKSFSCLPAQHLLPERAPFKMENPVGQRGHLKVAYIEPRGRDGLNNLVGYTRVRFPKVFEHLNYLLTDFR